MEFFFPLLAQNTRNAAWMAAWLWTIRTWSLWFYLLCIYTLSFLLWNMSFYFYVLRHVVVVLFHQCVSCCWISFPDYFWLLDTRTRSRLPLSIGALSLPFLAVSHKLLKQWWIMRAERRSPTPCHRWLSWDSFYQKRLSMNCAQIVREVN